MGTERKFRLSDLGALATTMLWAGLILFGLFLALTLLMFGVLTGIIHVFLHLIFGFWSLLATNLPRISVNAATWVPGVAALLLAVLGIHLFLRPWALKRGKRWPVGNSLALAALIPVLFVIAFIVPGVLLQVQSLSGTRWFHREQGKGHSSAREMVREYNTVAFIYASEHEGRYPETLADLPEDLLSSFFKENEKRGRHLWDRDLPREPLIYLGAGLTDSCDASLAIVISPPFTTDKGRQRFMGSIGGQVTLIPADEVDVWIQRALEARRAAASAPAPPSP